MRHGMKKYKIVTTPAHRKSLMRNLAIEVLDHGKIKTTHAKCKFVQAFIEKLITLAKEDSLANRRLAYSKLNNRSAVTNLFTQIAPKYKDRKGGYTRILKFSEGRVGDNSKMSLIALV